jgi:hypothetical protein
MPLVKFFIAALVLSLHLAYLLVTSGHHVHVPNSDPEGLE